ncbi:MAG: nicotinamide riboside transporter PnuC [Prevotellaceae bacterium]|jgi:nicotinamide mononucleotide transporter|nr:nicotinamide riboside transporter PnuC [Prevotellaceae bacterium]
MDMEIIGAIVGLLYLWLEYRASIFLWIAGMIMPAIYVVVFYEAGLYADTAINVYYLAAGMYGWWMWLRGRSSSEEQPIVHTPLRQAPALAATFLGSFLLIGILLGYTDSDVVWWDSLTTALSIVAMWMLARKQAEQWLVWIVADAVYVALYLYKGLEATAVLYALYTVIAIFGYRKWLKEIKRTI